MADTETQSLASERRQIEDEIDELGRQLNELDPHGEPAQRIRARQATLGERLHRLTRPD